MSVFKQKAISILSSVHIAVDEPSRHDQSVTNNEQSVNSVLISKLFTIIWHSVWILYHNCHDDCCTSILLCISCHMCIYKYMISQMGDSYEFYFSVPIWSFLTLWAIWGSSMEILVSQFHYSLDLNPSSWYVNQKQLCPINHDNHAHDKQLFNRTGLQKINSSLCQHYYTHHKTL